MQIDNSVDVTEAIDLWCADTMNINVLINKVLPLTVAIKFPSLSNSRAVSLQSSLRNSEMSAGLA